MLEIICILILATTRGLHCGNSIYLYFFRSNRATVLWLGVFQHGAVAANRKLSTPTCYGSKLSINVHAVRLVFRLTIRQRHGTVQARSCRGEQRLSDSGAWAREAWPWGEPLFSMPCFKTGQ